MTGIVLNSSLFWLKLKCGFKYFPCGACFTRVMTVGSV